jgi:hypothetical protein
MKISAGFKAGLLLACPLTAQGGSKSEMGGHQNREEVIHLEMTKATHGLSDLLLWVAELLNNARAFALPLRRPKQFITNNTPFVALQI